MTRHPLAKGFGAFALLIVLAVPSPAGASDAGNPAALVKEFQGTLVEVMREADTLGMDGRYKRLLPAVSHTFHLPIMARIATGAHWQRASEQQRTQLVDAVRRMSVTTLASLFDGYSGETFEIVGEDDGPQGTRLVRTQLVTGGGSRHNITYVAKRFDNGWRLIDAIVDDGISELKVRQSEYHQVLRQEGMEGLIRLLNGKADELIASR